MAFSYKPVLRAAAGNYSGAALVGTHSAVIGWTFDDAALRDGLHGFGIRRTEFDNRTDEVIELRWLGGYKRFAADDDGAVGDRRSLTAPFQRFRWNDYTLNPGRSYRYEVFPMRGSPGALTRDEAPVVFEFSPTREDDEDLGVYVNRGVTAAKAYFERFGNVHPAKAPNPGEVYGWLSRGLRESLIGIIEEAKSGEELHFAVYEFFDLELAHTIKRAADRGVAVRIVHDGKPGKKSTAESRHIVHASQLDQLPGVVVERTKVAISHNKFVVHLKGGQPFQLWTGSANLSENGFYFQTNSTLVIRDGELMQAYEAYFQNLTGDPERTPARNFNATLMAQLNQSPARFAQSTYFSPLRTFDIIDAAVDLIQNAQSMVLISAPFGVHRRMKEALGQNDKVIVEYGLANSTAGARIADLRRNATRFFPPYKLERYAGETWDAKAFGAHKIHAKTIIVDPYGTNPRVLTGSANFSDASCRSNDENALLIEGHSRLAAIYATEFIRMYDHYRSRYYIRKTHEANRTIRRENRERAKQGLAPKPERTIPIHLDPTKDWSRTAFDPASNSHKFADRLAFAGR